MPLTPTQRKILSNVKAGRRPHYCFFGPEWYAPTRRLIRDGLLRHQFHKRGHSERYRLTPDGEKGLRGGE